MITKILRNISVKEKKHRYNNGIRYIEICIENDHITMNANKEIV